MYSHVPIKRQFLLNVLFQKILKVPIKRTVHLELLTYIDFNVLFLLNVLFLKVKQYKIQNLLNVLVFEGQGVQICTYQKHCSYKILNIHYNFYRVYQNERLHLIGKMTKIQF